MKHNFFVAVGPNCWGIGTTKEEAIKKAKSNWPSWIGSRPVPKNFSVWATNAETLEQIRVGEVDGSVGVLKPFELEKIQTSALAVSA